MEWKALGVKLTSKALSFRIKIGRTREMLTDLSQHVNEEIVEVAYDYAVKLGLDALAAADHFRKVRRLGPAPSVADWSTRDWLQEKADKIAVRKAAEEAAMADD